jgi:glycosyltransferase involved in cell wall biosynthesis
MQRFDHKTMQPKIGIDFTSAARERAGIGRYARELVRALARLDHTNPYRLFVPRDAHADLLHFSRKSHLHRTQVQVSHPGNEFGSDLDDTRDDLRWPSNFSIACAPLTERVLAALWHRARVPLPIEAFIGTVDVFYSPDFLLPPTRAQRTIVTVHDLSYLRVPECFPEPLKRYLNNAVPRAVRRADLILADAASTQRDLADVYRVPPEKVKVLYPGVDARFRPDVAEDARTRVRGFTRGKPYLLSVGTLQPRKNYARLIEAFARLITHPALRFADLQLILAGGQGWMSDEIYQAVDRLGLRERVLFTNFVSDDDLPALYAMATLLVYPSLYEGFGLPIAEAMACGAPVVSSNGSSLPEVAGDAALYFDPRDVDAMADTLQRALSDDALRADLRAKGFAQVKQFSWERAARELMGYLVGSDG